MILSFWDASALVKRYSLEIGSGTVDHLFALFPVSCRIITLTVYAETFSVLLRKRNRGEIALSTFRSSVSLLQAEFLDTSEGVLLSVNEVSILRSLPIIERYNLNASDAAMLVTYLDYAHEQTLQGNSCLLLASDQRLLRAAQAEGLVTLDPEALQPEDIEAQVAWLMHPQGE